MFFSSKTQGKLILVLEIQSSLVRGSLAWISKDMQPQLFVSESIGISYKKGVDTTYFVKMTQKSLKEIINVCNTWLHSNSKVNFSPEIPKHISEVHYVLSSPWVASQARTVSTEYTENTKITDSLVEKILDKERTSSQAVGDESLTPIEEKIFDIKLNGYSVAMWRDIEAKHVEVSYALSVCSRDTMKRLRDGCEHVAHGRNVYFHSSLLLQYVCLRSIVMPNRDNYTLVHVHGELTDVVVIERGTCVFFGSYPIGVNTTIRKIAQETNMDVHTAESLVTLYLANKLDEENTNKLSHIISNLTNGWTGEFNKLFTGTNLEGNLPVSTYISARSHEEFFLRGYRDFQPTAHVELLEMGQIESNIALHKVSGDPKLVSMYVLAINNLEKE